jgi:hypothetical protein
METARIDFDVATAVTRQQSRPCIRASERRNKAITVPGILAELFSENDLGLQGLKMIFENVRFVPPASRKGLLSGVPMPVKTPSSRLIHWHRKRYQTPFIVIPCSAILIRMGYISSAFSIFRFF